MKDSARGITLLKLTTDGHEASRSLSATAELLVIPTALFSELSLVLLALDLVD